METRLAREEARERFFDEAEDETDIAIAGE
jgi:hypothetical protein